MLQRRDPIRNSTAEAVIPFATATPVAWDAARGGGRPVVAQMDFGTEIGRIGAILVYKLDHFGDFVIAQPALRDLRAAFPRAHIRLICGSWNLANARACMLVDEVRGFDYFPERSANWDGRQVEGMAVFDAAVAGRFDLAIDLRVDDDTRHLLGRVDARLRCGVGLRTRFPLLDIAFPGERSHGASRSFAHAAQAPAAFFPPAHFASGLPAGGPLDQQASLAELVAAGPLRGALVRLPAGKVAAAVGLSVRGFVPGPWGCSVTLELCREDGEMMVRRAYGRTSLHRLSRHAPVLEFDNPDPDTCYELRIRAEGRPLRGRLRFTGVHVAARAAPAMAGPGPASARLPAVELHVGETLALLVALIRQRTTALYPPPAETAMAAPAIGTRIVVAPFSNSSVRDWPVAHYARLITLMLAQPGWEVALVGTAAQSAAAERLVGLVGDKRLGNLVGKTRWADLSGLLQAATLVICNNSGVAHLAAALGAQVLAIYSGSHQPPEWGPRGLRSHALSYPVPCSPCGLENVADCTFEHRCMRMISPDEVFARANDLLAPAAADASAVPAPEAMVIPTAISVDP
jgi:ADP-heptose:LPS heptosyltransferase